MAALTVAMLGIGSLAINIAYVELSRTQLRTAADATAKAALVTMSETQSLSQARSVARAVCRQNEVLGKQLTFRNRDLEFGSAVATNGSYSFVKNAMPRNSVRLTLRFGDGSNNTAAQTFFSHFVGTDTFSGEEVSAAGRFDHDIMVVVDRSGSMAWDDSGVDFAYPGAQADDSSIQNYFRPPHPTLSRWASLVDALQAFDVVLGERDLNPQLGLVSYSSDYTFGVYHSDRDTLDQPLTKNTSLVINAAEQIGTGVLVGDTNITAGLQAGRRALVDRSVRRMTANRTIILLSDGVVTEGGDPLTLAATCVRQRIAIHTISFSDGADQDLMREVALATGGRHFHAPTGEALLDAFRTIAEELPATLTL